MTAVVLSVAASAGSARAQNAEWSFRFTPYVWASAVSGDVEAGDASASFETSFSDIVDVLDFGVLGTLEGDYGPYGFLTDTIYLSLSKDANTPRGILFERAEGEFGSLIVSGYAGYRLALDESIDLQLLAGARLFSMEVETRLVSARPAIADRTSKSSETWVNPVVGARLNAFATDELFGGISADIGGWTGGDLTWQAAALLGYRFDETWDVRAGYRYMAVEHEFDGGATLDAAFHGPMIGVGISF
ncbi:MAG: hypothetical protein ACFCVH_05240 [Alphaproteobacteria bacterium]